MEPTHTSPDRTNRFRSLLTEALALEPRERTAFLNNRCRGEAELRDALESVLHLEERAEGRIGREGESTAESESLIGDRVGRIQVRELLGKGGMGEVYAGFDEKLKRNVALKTIRARHRLSQQARERFLREAQTLSALGHPNICQIYDLLETPSADLLVLERVTGRSLTRVISDGLDLKQKLAIAIEICEALAEAHAHGIIHRDLKPDNVMLTEEGRVKVLDFGLARAVESDGPTLASEPPPKGTELRGAAPADPESGMPIPAEAATFPCEELSPEGSALRTDPSFHPTTAPDTIVGTPGYLSPEQARSEPLSAASDCYALGLVLQELFTESRPFPPHSTPRERILRAVRGETLPVRGIDRDLAALIDKLESVDPAERPTAREARSRLEWVLRKPQRLYRRIAIALTVLAITAGTAKYVVDLREKEQAAERARRVAEQARASELEVTDFLVDLFEVSDPNEARGNTVTAREILDRGAERIARELGDRPLVQARLMEAIGTVYGNLGLYEPASQLVASGLANREAIQPPDHPDIATSLMRLAWIQGQQGRYESAEILLKRALAIRLDQFGEEDPRVAATLNSLGEIHWEQGRFQEAEPVLVEAAAIRETALGSDDPDLATTLNNLALVYSDQGRFEESEPLYRRALAIYEAASGPDHPDVAMTLNNLAMSYWEQGKRAEAAPLFERSLAIREKVFGPDHFNVAMSLNNLAMIAYEEGDLDEAERLFRRALEVRERSVGPDHRSVAMNLSNLGMILGETNRPDEAEALLLRALATWERGVGSDHPDIGYGLLNLGNLYVDMGRLTEARPLFERALAIWTPSLGEGHRYLALPLRGLAQIERRQGRPEEAVPLYERALAILVPPPGTEDPERSDMLAEYQELLRELGRTGEAEATADRLAEPVPEGR